MNFLKFFFGILLAQVATYVLILLAPVELNETGILRLTVPLLFIALTIAFWFSSIAVHHSKDSFTNERDKLRTDTERYKERITKEAQNNIIKEATKTHAKANFKVGAAFAASLGVGALFIFAQMITAGLLALAASGGALGGYYWRGKQLAKKKLIEIDTLKDRDLIESKPSRIKFLTRSTSPEV